MSTAAAGAPPRPALAVPRVERGVLAAPLAAPLARIAAALRVTRLRQACLSGIHNPFGRAVAHCDPWRLLDVCESDALLDAVAPLIGPDIVLWDSELYLDEAAWETARGREGRHWPAQPLAGAVVDIEVDSAEFACCEVHAAARLPRARPGAHYVVRYMPGTSLYNRDPLYAPNRVATQERPLVNYLNRPLWLVRGEDRAGSDFAAGYQTPAPGWAVAATRENERA
ncbi:MAG: hypothetical protein IT529_04805 [Burkholderiales bacterium]|nr:hypothetical protein [Burkholderiales bacterium]